MNQNSAIYSHNYWILIHQCPFQLTIMQTVTSKNRTIIKVSTNTQLKAVVKYPRDYKKKD